MLNHWATYMFEATRLYPNAQAQNGRTNHAYPQQKKPRNPMTKAEQDRVKQFAQLHQKAGTFVMPNAWDAGSARLLETLGFRALATTSAGLAFSLGVRDSTASLSRAQVMENAHSIVEATQLPVSADLENGFGARSEAVEQTIREAEMIGLSGGAIEDASADPDRPIYDFDHAVDRIRAAVAAKSNPAFQITARAENYLYGRPDLGDTIKRLQAFEDAGADVVYAPGLRDIASVRAVCEAVKIPVNVVVGLNDASYSIADLAQVGVRRVSTGGSLARAAMGEMMRSATELRDRGTFSYAQRAISDADAARHMRPPPVTP
ncbi:MAG: isocitrate lyase/phosphoenolpyruvate mutase family protein [Sulfitobacter sp.]